MHPGTVLTDGKRRFKAVVQADGSLVAENGTQASIHKIGAVVQGAEACNGWTFWHRESPDGSLLCIDDLRKIVRDGLKIAGA